MKWSPLNDQIIVRPLLPAEQTTGGLVIPDDARGRPQRGVVLAVGPGLPSELTSVRRPMGVTEGDLVLFGQYAGMNHDLDGEQVLLMRDQEALAAVPRDGYALIEHVDARGTRAWHLADESCEQCPKVDLSAERAQLRAARATEDAPADAGEPER